jgi:hypothetical protein
LTKAIFSHLLSLMGEMGRVRGKYQIFLPRDFFIKMEKKA